MTFIHPRALFLLLLLVPFGILAVVNFRTRKRLIRGFMSETAFSRLGVTVSPEVLFFRTLIIFLAMAALIFALAGPSWGERYEIMETRGLEMVFLLDTSLSMEAQDVHPSRLEAARNLIITIVGEFKADFLSLITFAGTAHVQCPLTIDYDAFIMMTRAADISPPGEQGTNLPAAFRFALEAFRGERNDHRLIILITDGEDHSDEIQSMMTDLSVQKVVVFAVGIGSLEGAPIPIKNDQDEITGWKKDRAGNIVNSRLNTQVLKEIADGTGGLFFRMDELAETDYFVSLLKKYGKEVLNKRTRLIRINRFHYPLIAGIILLLIELFIPRRRIKWKTE